MKTSDFYYDLPQERIAQTPIEPRDSSRLLVYNRGNGHIEHRHFYDLPNYLHPGDALVINETRVIPARLYGRRKDTSGEMEFLLLKRLDATRWEVLSRPARRAILGRTYVFGNGLLTGSVVEVLDEGRRVVEFTWEGVFENVLDRCGAMPLPPYIHATLEDRERYQTVYSRINGSVAAPTAGLHFTAPLFERIRVMGISLVPVLLHVGLGTFRPVKVDDVTDHHMHAEHYEVSPEAAKILNRIRINGGRIVCTGTTSARTLETVTDTSGVIHPGSGETEIFIYPGYTFHGVDALITNFHLPESTLLMMVSAFAGKEEILSAYRIAVNMKYRFFSFGDAMLIV